MCEVFQRSQDYCLLLIFLDDDDNDDDDDDDDDDDNDNNNDDDDDDSQLDHTKTNHLIWFSRNFDSAISID